MFTALLSISFYSLLESLRNLSKKKSSNYYKNITTPKKNIQKSFNSEYLIPKKKILFRSKNDEENQSLLNKSKNLSISKLLGETQIIELVEYKTKIRSDFKEIFQMLKDPKLQLLLLVVTLENITPEISCIFFYYFIEILKFSFFDVNSVFVFASLGFLISLTILNFEFIESSFENFYKVTSFLLSIAYFLNLRYDELTTSLVTGFYSRVGIKEVHLVYFITVFSELFKELNTVPLLALFNRQTPKHIEATAISFFSSIFSLSKLISTLLGALLGFAFAIHSSNYTHMYPIVLIQCIFTTLTTFCIFFIKFPKTYDTENNNHPHQDHLQFSPISILNDHKVNHLQSLMFRANLYQK